MGFKENLLKKMAIDNLSAIVRNSLQGDYDSGRRIDKMTMKQLLEESPYEALKIRDLELYLKESEDDTPYILVLDNDLPIYHTTPEDVALRKSPTIKEMVSIKNAIKILNDSKVIVSKKEESLASVRKECIDLLDLSFGRNDIVVIEKDGIASLERAYLDGIKEALKLYAELLGLAPVPKRFQMGHHEIFAKEDTPDNGQYRIGPIIMYSIINDKLKLFLDKISGTQKEISEFLKGLSSGSQTTHYEGEDVFKQLTNMTMALPKDGSSLYYPAF